MTWNRQEIEDQWVGMLDRGCRILRSPALPFERAEEIDEIEVEVVSVRARAELIIGWSDQAAPEPRALLTTRRVFTITRQDSPQVLRLSGAQVSEVHFKEQEPPLRHLFLTFDPDVLAVREVRVWSRGSGPRRFRALAMSGVIRPAVAVAGSASISGTATVAPDTRLAVWLAADTVKTVRLRLVARSVESGRQAAEVEQTLEVGQSWVAGSLPMHQLDGTFAFELSLEVEEGRVLCSEPVLLRPAPRGRPNVVLYVEDALRATALGHYGAPRNTSPFFDGLAESSLVFENCTANASWTKPSVVSLMTSLYPQAHLAGVRSHGDVVPEAASTLQEVLQRNGYLTASFSANPLGSNLSNLHLGFDTTLTPGAFPALAATGKVPSDVVTDEVLAWLEAHSDVPFFIFIHTMDPHMPLTDRPGPGLMGGSQRDFYDREVFFNDRQLERLFRWLENRHLSDSTLLVVTADHGESFGEHGSTGHGTSVYEEEVHVPLLLHYPERLAPQQVLRPVQLVDVMPTVLSLCGVDPLPEELAGIDLTPGRESHREPEIVATRFAYPSDSELWDEGYTEQTGLRSGPWKLVVIGDAGAEDATMRLFDLDNDPTESVDLSAGHPEVVARLLERLRAHLERQHQVRQRLHGAGSLPTPLTINDEDRRRLQALGYHGS